MLWAGAVWVASGQMRSCQVACTAAAAVVDVIAADWGVYSSEGALRGGFRGSLVCKSGDGSRCLDGILIASWGFEKGLIRLHYA